MEMKENVFDIVYEPLAGSNFTNLLRLMAQNRFHVSIRYGPRMLYALTLSGLIGAFHLKEELQFRRKIQHTEISHPPLFIIGHWRSGTTYLHNVISRDETFGYCSTFTATIPGVFLSGEKLFKPILSASIPEKRPMDDADMGADLPQEEEYAIGAFTPYAYYNGWCFPRHMTFYNRFVCMENVPQAVIDEWKGAYLYLLKKLTLYRGGRRLALKNPSNTARIKLLLDMFPDAQFVHIHRNPYEIYFSMMKFLRIVLPRYCVQRPPPMKEIERHMMDLYVQMYRKYLRERDEIPEGNLTEVRYDDFLKRPMTEVKRIYAELNLDSFRDARERLSAYVKSQKNIRRSTYTMDEETKEEIYRKWKFAFEAFGYER
ncbi:MAG TPA: sulfotransferase [Thermoplasmatales archaeon]|nr:sulfotransferase [Thermoplasmatales archaeon]